MASVVIFMALVLPGLGHGVTCAGTIYQKVSKDGDNSNVPMKGYHQCSLKNDCKFVAIPVGKANGKVYLAETMQELESIGKELRIWKKIEPQAPTQSSKQTARSVKAFKSCKKAKQAGVNKSGEVKLSLPNNTTINVNCDMLTDKGGWIVFQRRTNSSVDFERDWQDYEKGFGNLNSNFWLGLKALHDLTSNGNWTLRFDLKANDGSEGYAKYTRFKIGGIQQKYSMTYDTYSGNIGDALMRSKGAPFSTHDNDNDQVALNCAAVYRGGWWHSNCFDGIVNNWYPGTRESQSNPKEADKMTWKTWKNQFGDILFSEMKIKEEN